MDEADPWHQYSRLTQILYIQGFYVGRKTGIGKMPPKGFREKNPDAAPTKEEAKIICDWATSIQVVKK